MRKILWVLLPWLAIVSPAAHGHEVEVLETYPPGDRVELGPGQECHLRGAYTADPIARIFARPYLDRKRVSLGKSVSVRGTLGGRRILKQKKIIIYNNN